MGEAVDWALMNARSNELHEPHPVIATYHGRGRSELVHWVLKDFEFMYR
jgi:hypothetical protein